MSTLLVDGINDADGGGPKATLPTSGGSAFTLGPNWGAMEFVSGANISAATNLDITGFVAGYDYIIEIAGSLPATDGVMLEARFSQSTTFDTGSSYSDEGSATATSISLIRVNAGNASTEGLDGVYIIPEPNVGSRTKRIVNASTTYALENGTTRAADYSGAGSFIANTNAIDGVRFFWSSGDWTANGKCYVFRRRLS